MSRVSNENVGLKLALTGELKTRVSPPCGTLSLHMRQALVYNQTLRLFRKYKSTSEQIRLQVKVIMGCWNRTSKIYQCAEGPSVTMDDLILLSVQLHPEDVHTKDNQVEISLWSLSGNNKSSLIGRGTLNLLECAQDLHSTRSVEIFSSVSGVVGVIRVDVAVSYGALGYGMSNQLNGDHIYQQQALAHTLFPRIAPHQDRHVGRWDVSHARPTYQTDSTKFIASPGSERDEIKEMTTKVITEYRSLESRGARLKLLRGLLNSEDKK